MFLHDSRGTVSMIINLIELKGFYTVCVHCLMIQQDGGQKWELK